MEDYFGTDRNAGVLIASIDPDSPASEAFLKAGDVILEIDGKEVSARFVEELPAFYDMIASHSPGSQVRLKVLRDEQTYSFDVTTRSLGELSGEDFQPVTYKKLQTLIRHYRLLEDAPEVWRTGFRMWGEEVITSPQSGELGEREPSHFTIDSTRTTRPQAET